jgi:formiminotetrahydrofolate cyclodeaminase
MQHLLGLPAEALLNKFGSGKHAPGSGSAAALMGLLSAKLVLTVGQLTLIREDYKSQHAAIKASCDRIQTFVVPRLERLFQEDAEVFDRVIVARRARDSASGGHEKRRYAEQALEQLRFATAIPFNIAETCLELIDLAASVFDGGFKGARGDTGAALSSAVAGVLASVFVINLNLKSFRGSYWAREQRKECDNLQARVIEKYEAALTRVVKLRAEDVATLTALNPQDLIAALSQGTKRRYSQREIEERVAVVHALVWRKRMEIWIDEPVPTDPVAMLSPDTALRLLGYSFEMPASLGTFRHPTGSFEVAGLLEGRLGRVSISEQLIPAVRRFTAAHELGHVVLHPYLKEAHRDRPLDGSSQVKDRTEREADRFASLYLMPIKLVIDRFAGVFGSPPFVLSDETAFALFGSSIEESRKQLGPARQFARQLARELAHAGRFNGHQIVPLATQFGVSIETMAIRIEELRLLKVGG